MKKAKLFMMLALLVMGVSNVFAQNVTISPTTGNLVAALTSGNEEGFEKGWSSLWMHEQLPLTFTVSDHADLKSSGITDNPAGNINKSTDVSRLIVAGGNATDLYCVLSLPKGYRITGYRMVLLNNLNSTTVQNLGTGAVSKTMYEVDGLGTNGNSNFDLNTAKAQTEEMGSTDDTKEYVIERRSNNETDMGNQLYFRLRKNSTANAFYAVTIKSFEIQFTAEGTFDAVINNNNDGVGVAKSFVTSPFKTCKIDIGDVERRRKDRYSPYYFAYSYENVKELDAYNYIYQEDAVHDGVPMDGDENNTIYPVKVNNEYHYAFGNNTYFAEPPINVRTQSGLTAPVGYRIVGAEITPLAGQQTSQGSVTIPAEGYYISFSTRWDTYYLSISGNNLTWANSKGSATRWILDSETNGLYAESGGTRYYLASETGGNDRPLSLATAAPNNEYGTPGYYDLILFEHDGNTYIGWDSDNPDDRWYLRAWRSGGMFNASNNVYISKNNKSNLVDLEENDIQTTVPLPDFDPGSYTLTVYGTDKDTPVKTVTINGSADPITLSNLNNDAVKFKVSGLADGKMALFNVTLKLQFLNPYIDNMDIVCHDPDNQLELAQSFQANDFRVSGGAFTFYIPGDYRNIPLTFTFRDLYSKYGDDTYNHVSNEYPRNSRYNFVNSAHFNAFNSSSEDGINNVYNNRAEAASTTTETDRIAATNGKIRTQVSTTGNIRFKFNNAEDLTNTLVNTSRKHLEENPFSIEKYLESKDPDDKTTNARTGDFIECKLMAEPTEGSTLSRSGTYYVFTADETRYNIAPTTEWQHRYYAFYRMDIELIAKDYTPDLTWKELYDKTYYRVKKDNGEETKTHSMWGVDVKAKDGNNVVTGYLTVKQILEAINSDITGKKVASADGKRKLEGKDQILYIDGSNLYNILSTSKKEGTTTTKYSLADLKTDLGVNALVFLPERTTSTDDNFAKKSSDGVFYAGKDINITDKQPFFSPHDININYPNVAKYDRILTSEQNGQVCNASVVLPFDIDLDDEGYHDIEGGGRFYLAKLKDNQTLKKEVGNDINTAKAFFDKITEKKGAANTPYVVKVENQNKEDENISFKVRCVGSKIVATPYQYSEAGIKTNGIFTPLGSVRGYYGGDEYNFTPTGTFRGYTFENAGNASTKEQIFYFARNSFYTSKTLRANEPMLVQPFRSYFDYTVNGTNNSKLSRFFISFDDSDEFGGTNGINEIERDVDLAVIPGKGVITLVARADKDVTIHAVNGHTIDKCNLNAGESRTVAVPAGVYVINGVKMVVK